MVEDEKMKTPLRVLSAFAVGILLCAVPVFPQVVDAGPAALAEVGVEEHFDAQVPIDLEFRNSNGEKVRLSDYFDSEKPVILTLNYYRCPMLCGLQLNGFLNGLKDLQWTPGERFEIVTISIDPLETPELAKEKKANYLKQLAQDGAGKGWHFLTGGEPNIKAVAESVGFNYTYDEETAQYAHAAALMVLTPDGRVARYLYGIEYPKSDLRLALVEASEGKIGSPFDQLLLYCFHYDPTGRRYSPVAMNIMRVGGGATVLILGAGLGLLWIRDIKRRKKSMKREA